MTGWSQCNQMYWGGSQSKDGGAGVLKLKRGDGHCALDSTWETGANGWRWGCDGDAPTKAVCGQCGILSDASYPDGTQAYVNNKSIKGLAKL